MRKFLIFICCLMLLPLNAEKYAGEIFNIGVGVKNMAMGNTGLTDENSPAMAYWNSALLVKSKLKMIDFMHSEEFNGLLKYDVLSAVWGEEKNKFNIIVARIGINKVPLTKLENEDQEINENNKPYVYDSVTNSDVVAYFGISRKIYEDFYLGFTPKVVYRSLAKHNGYGFGSDLSSFWDIDSETRVAATIKDFFSTQIFWQNGTHEIVNPSIRMEISRKLLFPIKELPLRLTFGVDSYFEGRKESATLYLGESSYDFHLGADLEVSKFVSIYSGYDVRNFTAGISVHYSSYHLYYAFKNDAYLEQSHRISLGYKFL